MFSVDTAPAITVFPETERFVEVAFVIVPFERIAVPPPIVALVRFALLAAKLVVVAFVIVALSEVRFKMLATVANRLVKTFNQVTVEVEIVVVPNVVVAAVNELVAVTFPPVRFGAEILDTLIVPTVKLLIVDVATV
jgi:hypothetical protein